MGTYFFSDQYENVNFLGEEVQVPSSERIYDYREKMQEIIESYGILESRIKSQIDECKARGSRAWAWIQTEFWTDVLEWDENGGLIIDLLNLIESNSIFVCPSGDSYEKYGEYTRGYKELEKLRNVLIREAMEIENSYERSYQMGSDAAFNNAASNIKGMRYGIITNSAIDLLAYNAISNMTLRSQIKKADEQYTRELKTLAKSVGDIYKSQLLSLMYEQYVPAARECIKLWANEMIENLIEYEVNYDNNQVFAEINRFDPEESKIILNSISENDSENLVKSKLLEAFKTCPYEKSIYLKIVQMGLMNRDLCDYASMIGRDEYFLAIKKEAKNTCNRNLENIEFVKKCIDFMVNTTTSQEQILQEVYENTVNNTIKKYEYLRGLINEKNSLKVFVKNDLGISNVKKFVEMDNEKIKNAIKVYVDNIVSRDLWDILIDNHYIELEGISLVKSNDWNEFNYEYINELLKKVMDYAQIIEKVYINYQEQIKEYDKNCSLISEEIESIKTELNQVGFFGIMKKKLLKKALEEKKMEYYNFSRENKPQFVWK